MKGTKLWQAPGSPIIQGRSRHRASFWQQWLRRRARRRSHRGRRTCTCRACSVRWIALAVRRRDRGERSWARCWACDVTRSMAWRFPAAWGAVAGVAGAAFVVVLSAMLSARDASLSSALPTRRDRMTDERPDIMTREAIEAEEHRRFSSPRRVRRRDPRSRAADPARPVPHGVPARPRPHHPLQGVSAALAQDAGVPRARGRPLPDAADAHARGLADLALDRSGAGAQRGPDRGDRARPRSRATRRSGTPASPRSTTRCARCTRRATGRCPRYRHNVQSLRIVEQARVRGQGPEPHLGGPRRDPRAHGSHVPDDARGADRADRRPDRLREPRHRRRPARGRADRVRPARGAARGARAASRAPASPRWSTT